MGPTDIERGARNLLLDCAGATPGQSLLIVREEPSHDYYDPDLAGVVAAAARSLGLQVRVADVAFDPKADSLPPTLAAQASASDHTLFLARLGDQLRFRAMPEGSRAIVSYALDARALGSGFGTAPHGAFRDLKALLDDVFASAGVIRVTCPLGTDFVGGLRPAAAEKPTDVTVRRFPMSVFAPLDARGFRGRVAVAHLLVGTGSRYYEPYALPLSSTLFAQIGDGRLLEWQGEPDECERARRHYAQVAGMFGIDGGVVHSWHAGIHPGCAYRDPALARSDRWSGSAFGNPRLLHFHTCGDYAPGEICWNVVDPTITLDGVAIWDRGRIRADNIPGAASILDTHPEVRALFDHPAQDIGIGPSGWRA